VPVAPTGGLVAVGAGASAFLITDQRPLVRGVAPLAAPPPVPAAFQTGPGETGPAPSSQPTPAGAPTVAMATPDEAGHPKPAAEPAERKHAKAERRGEHEARPAAKPAREAAVKEPKPAAAKAEEPAIEAPRPGTKRGDDLDELLKAGTAAKKEERKADADESLPDTLGQEQIKTGMSAVRSKVQACFEKYQVPGLAKLNVSISKAGAVTSARIMGDFASSPTGDCVVAAVKGATFPRFKGKPLSISYTFLLR